MKCRSCRSPRSCSLQNMGLDCLDSQDDHITNGRALIIKLRPFPSMDWRVLAHGLMPVLL